MSLIEATIILFVMAILAAVVAPATRGYVEDGRNVKAQGDVQSIGGAIDEVLRNTGTLCLSINGSSCAKDASGRVELLMSGSDVDGNKPTVVVNAVTVPANTASGASLNWAGGSSEVPVDRRDLMDEQFVTNTPGYAVPTFTAGGGPRTGIGWRGPYLNGPIDVDPWGFAYQASTVFLAVASDAADGTTAGLKRGGWTNDVMVISAGSNGTIQTTFGSPTTATASPALTDDVIYVVQGGTH